LHDAYANGGWNGYLRYVAENGTTKMIPGYKKAYGVAAFYHVASFIVNADHGVM
jgi:hypothetical protein